MKKKHRVTVEISSDAYRFLKIKAIEQNTTMQEILAMCTYIEIYKDREPNDVTKKAMDEADRGENLSYYDSLADFRKEMEV